MHEHSLPLRLAQRRACRTFQEQQAASEEKRQSDRQDDLTLTVFLWVLAAYLAFFIWMLDQMPT